MKKILNNKNLQHLAASFGGQIGFMLANFILFIFLIKGFKPEEYGAWAIYITLISIADGLRQGFVQNGYIALFIKHEKSKTLTWSALTLNLTLVAILALLASIVASLWTGLNTETSSLLNNGWKTLLSLGLLQFFNSFYQAQKNQVLYLVNNLIYLVAFIITIAAWSVLGTIEFKDVLSIQLISVIPSTLFFIYKAKAPSMPKKEEFKELISFGKYAAGTNLSSLLFQKVDILMIGYFLDPTAVAIYHLTMKVLAYAELPMQAISQFIYPRMVSTLHLKGASYLNIVFSQSVLLLLAFVMPISLILLLFNDRIILLLSSEEYLQAQELIVLFAAVMIFKPWGRIFGLSLDALGKPKLNFMMLIFSLIVNVTLNLILIPVYGLYGGALATATSIVATILLGQLLLTKTQHFNPLKETYLFIKNFKKQELSWN